VRVLAEVEGAELRWSRRKGNDRRDRGRGFERRQSAGDRRVVAYPEMIDLVIEEILKTHVDPDMQGSGTWRDRHDADDI
jgi:hypothetical protein